MSSNRDGIPPGMPGGLPLGYQSSLPLLGTPSGSGSFAGLSGLLQQASASFGHRGGGSTAGMVPFFPQQPMSPSSNRKPTPTGPPRSGGAPSGGGGGGGGSASKKQCNCKNSRCLKLYCECFASGRYCEACNCVNCFNNRENEGTRQSAVETILERNPNAFRPKIQGSESEAAAVRVMVADGSAPPRHTKGCNCKKSGCLKKYCECFQASISCTDICKCMDCKNFDGSEARAQVMAVQDMGVGGGLLGGTLMASPSKRSRPQSAQRQPSGLLASLGGSGSFPLPSPAAAPNLSSAQTSQRSYSQQVVLELVRPNIIEELCALLFMAADDEGTRARKVAAAASVTEASGQGQGLDGADGGGGQEPMDVDVLGMPPSVGPSGGGGASGDSGFPATALSIPLTASTGLQGPASASSGGVQEAQERVVIEEFGAILGKIAESAMKRVGERQQFGQGAAATATAAVATGRSGGAGGPGMIEEGAAAGPVPVGGAVQGGRPGQQPFGQTSGSAAGHGPLLQALTASLSQGQQQQGSYFAAAAAAMMQAMQQQAGAAAGGMLPLSQVPPSLNAPSQQQQQQVLQQLQAALRVLQPQ